MIDASAPLLLHVFPSFAFGGAQMRLVNLMTAFGDRYRHVVIALDGNYACAQRLAIDLPVQCEKIDAPKRNTLGNVRRFRHRLHELAPDVLVTHNWGAIEWAIANIPRIVRHIHIEDGFGPEERNSQIRRRVLTRRLVLRRSTVVLPSRNLWRIASSVWGLDCRQVHYLPNGINLDHFAVDQRSPREVPVIGTVTGLRNEKNLARLLRAFHSVTERVAARLVIVGEGPERSKLEILAAQLELCDRVHFAGQSNDPSSFYRAFDIFALSSDTEQMPLSVIEAMASGLPVAATDVGDVATMVAEENRPYIVPLDEAALADALITLSGDDGLRGRLGAANRAKAETEFDQAAMIGAYAALFDGTTLAAA
jgi:glycosyltransferase involved in cell wall biosynthesis